MGKVYDKVMDSRKELTQRLLAEMEQGELLWTKGWKSEGKRPYNPVTKAVYKGGNRFRLMLASYFERFSDNRWVTFSQAKEKGWTVKKGEKGMLCEKWIFEEKKTIEDPITLADQFVKSSACPIIENKNETEAYYSPIQDEVHLPARDSFYSANEFLATAIHEMGHSTGHPSRLNRDQKSIFGSKEYAKEELIAELSSVFVQADLGIDIGAKQFANHAAYLQNWMSVLKENPNALFQASADTAYRCIKRKKKIRWKNQKK